MRKRAAIGGLALLGIIVVATIYFARGAAATGSDGRPNPIPPKSATAHYAPGVSAIRPSGPKHSAMVLASGTMPSLTEADVRAYFANGGMPKAASGAHPVIVDIQFITAKQAGTITHGAFHDRPDDVVVCYVLLKGPFDVPISHPAPLVGQTYQPPTENYIEEVFDAYSGNLLMSGIPGDK